MQITNPHSLFLVKEITELVSNMDFTVIMLTDEGGGEKRPIDLSVLSQGPIQNPGANSSHLVFCGKENPNYFGFHRKTDVRGIWEKQMEQIRALAVRDCLAWRQKEY